MFCLPLRGESLALIPDRKKGFNFLQMVALSPENWIYTLCVDARRNNTYMLMHLCIFYVQEDLSNFHGIFTIYKMNNISWTYSIACEFSKTYSDM